MNIEALKQVRDQLQCTDETGLNAEACYALGETIEAHLRERRHSGSLLTGTTWEGLPYGLTGTIESVNAVSDALLELENIKRECESARAGVTDAVAYWAAISDDGEIVVAYPANDGNKGEAARTECNQYINDALLNDRAVLRLVPLYEAVAPMLASAWVPEELLGLVLNAVDNLTDLPINSEWAERWTKRTMELLAAPKPEKE